MDEQLKNINKLPPQAVDAEKSLLGSLMLDKDAIIKIADFIKPLDFYRAVHQEIFSAILDLFAKGEPIDVLTVSNRLKEKNLLEQTGGNSYLAELVNSVATSSHILVYAKIVQRKRVLRDLIQASQEIETMSYGETEDIDMVLDQAEKMIFGIAQKGMAQKFVPVKDMLEEAFERIEMLSRQGTTRGVRTGFADLDKLLSGMQKSDLVILASRPSLGKSALAINIASHVAIREKMPVGIFSLEMSKDQIVDRLIAAESGIDLWKLRTGRLSHDPEKNDFEKIQQAMAVLAEAPLFIDDSSLSNIVQMRAMARRLQAENGLGLIIVDYLQLMEPRLTDVSLVQQMSEISRSLKSLARELNIPVLALSQLSRAVEHRTPPIPRLSDLRETGAIEQDADVVMFIHREDRYNEETERKNIADLIIAKHRNGPVGKVELFFDEKTVSFKSLQKEYTGGGGGEFSSEDEQMPETSTETIFDEGFRQL